MNGTLSVSGSNGPRLGPEQTQAAKSVLSDLLNGNSDMREFREHHDAITKRHSVTMLINDQCNLACNHCYLQTDGLSHPKLSVDEWICTIDSAMVHGVHQFVLAGKEPLAGSVGPKIIDHIGQMKRDTPGLRFGIITNGTLMARHHTRLKLATPCYIDLSMEGGRIDNDAVRGEGAFEMARPNVEWAAEQFGEKLFITLTLQKQNIGRFSQAVQSFSQLGVVNVGASFYIPLVYTNEKLALNSNDLRSFFDSLENLGRIPLEREMCVQIDAGTVAPEALLAFMNSDWYNFEAMEVDISGFLYGCYQFCNGLSLYFRFIPWPLSLGSSSRLSVDGHLVSVDDSLQPRLYAHRSLANLRDFDFDFGAAWRHAQNNLRLRSIDADYDKLLLPRLKQAHLGNNGYKTVRVVGA